MKIIQRFPERTRGSSPPSRCRLHPLQDPAASRWAAAAGRFEESTERTVSGVGGTIIKTHMIGSFDIDFEDGSREKEYPVLCGTHPHGH